MFIIYFVLWVVLNGRWTTEIGLFGLVFAGVLYAFTCRFMHYSMKQDIAFLRSFGGQLRYGATVIREIVAANLNVMRMILDLRKEPEPQLVQFDAELPDDLTRVMYANSITLTPGTITVSLKGSHYWVHCLDKSTAEGLEDGAMITALRALCVKPEAANAELPAQTAQEPAGATAQAEDEKEGEEA